MSAISSENKLPKGAWLVVALLFFIGALNYLDRIMITTMRSSIIDAMPMSDAQFGLLTSVFLWTYGILSPFAGFLADKFKRSRVLVVSLLVWSAVTWLTAYSKTFEQLLITRILMGISEACYFPAALALISDYHKSSTRSLATGIHMVGIQVGSTFGFLGGVLAENHTWNYVFIFFGFVGMLYSLLVALLLRDPPKENIKVVSESHEDKINFFTGVANLFRKRAFLLMLGFWTLLGVVGWLVIGWLPTYYKEHFNLSQGTAGLYATGYLYPAQAAGLIIGGLIADRWSKTNRYARIKLPAIGFCIAAPFVFLASNTTILPIAIAAFMVYAFTRAFGDANMMPMLCMVVDPRYRATGYGVLNFFGTIVGGIALYAGGILRDSNVKLGLIYQCAALLLVGCAVCLFLAKPKDNPDVSIKE
ncbi:MAG TPA: MFS transporter [Bacteroidales bacterium]|mgnify:CR=1 FL=1|nr:MFS transporter [Bacteroidales bacterium]HPT22197.1 MFS transporter [Bacteroidales bacterium]